MVRLRNVLIPAAVATGACAWGAFHPRSQLFGPTIRTLGGSCALTFDDGPNPRATPALLAILQKHRISATFFVLGKYVDDNPGLASEIVAAGHSIGNHTYDHFSLVFFSRRHIVDELNRCTDAVFRATGQAPVGVRPPFGFRGPQFHAAAQEAGYTKTFMWSVSGRDWKRQAAQSVSRRLSRVRPGDIVLLHDGDHRTSNEDRGHTLSALELCVPRWQESGLQFVAIACEL